MHFVLESNTKAKYMPCLLEAVLHKEGHFPQMTVCHSVETLVAR